MSELSRYARQVVLPSMGVDGQRQLLDSTVLVIGVGGLGSIASAYLAGAGVGRLVVCDADRLELSNLQRQVLYRESDLGRRKAEAAAAQLRALNGEITVEACEGRLDAATLPGRIREADLVLDCSDNFATRSAVNACCVAERRPLVSGAAVRLEGQLLLVDPRRRDAACYACWFGNQPAEDARCEDGGVLGPVVGAVGALQALLAIRLLTGGAVEPGVLHRFDAHRLNWQRMRGARDPACPVCAKETDDARE